MWQTKKILKNEKVGKILVKQREKLGLSVKQICKDYGFSSIILENIEKSDYKRLPLPIYSVALLKKYADILQLSAEECALLWEEEYLHWQMLSKESDQKKIYELPLKKKWKFTITPIFWHRALFVLLGFVVLSYIGWRVDAAIAPIEFTLTSPSDKLITQEKSIEISGSTEPESVLMVNGYEIVLTPDGTFYQQVHLQNGLNVLEFQLSKKYRPTQSLIRQIFVTADSNEQLTSNN
jgi:cytoskeletal protein RodZ